MIKSRNIGYDFLKFLAAISVVFQHVLGFNIQGENAILYYGLSFSIPIFFMVNGGLILNKDNINLEYSGKKIYNLLFLSFLWNSMYALLTLILKNEVISPFRLTIDSLKQQGFFSVFWFFGALCIIYLTVPFWHQKFKNVIYARNVVLILCLCLIVVDVLSMWKTNSNLAIFQINIPQRERIWTWFAYFCIGGYLAKPAISEKIRNKIPVKVNALFLIIFTIMVIVWDFVISRFVYHYYFLEYFYVNLLTLLWSITIFVFFGRIKYYRIENIIIKASSLSIGVYVIHWILIQLSLDFLSSMNVSNIIIAILYSFISLICSYILYKTPILNRMIKL